MVSLLESECKKFTLLHVIVIYLKSLLFYLSRSILFSHAIGLLEKLDHLHHRISYMLALADFLLMVLFS